jgi:hypothetical protein
MSSPTRTHEALVLPFAPAHNAFLLYDSFQKNFNPVSSLLGQALCVHADMSSHSATAASSVVRSHADTLAFIRAFTGRKVKRYAIYPTTEGAMPTCSGCIKSAPDCACTTQIYAPHKFKEYNDSSMWGGCRQMGCLFHRSHEWPADPTSKEMYNACKECLHPKILCLCDKAIYHDLTFKIKQKSNMPYERYIIYTADRVPTCSVCNQASLDCQCKTYACDPHRCEALFNPRANFYSRGFKCTVSYCYMHNGHKWFKKTFYMGHENKRVLKRMPCKMCRMPKMVCICHSGITHDMIITEMQKRMPGDYDRFAIYYLGGASPICSKCSQDVEYECTCKTGIHAPHGREKCGDNKCQNRSCFSHTGTQWFQIGAKKHNK